MLHIYKLAQKLKIKKEKEKIKPKLKALLFNFLPPSSFIFPVVDIDGLTRCILACILIVPVLL
jgi:hypothetical protein